MQTASYPIVIFRMAGCLKKAGTSLHTEEFPISKIGND